MQSMKTTWLRQVHRRGLAGDTGPVAKQVMCVPLRRAEMTCRSVAKTGRNSRFMKRRHRMRTARTGTATRPAGYINLR